MTGSSMTDRFDHNRTEERPRVSIPEVMSPALVNEQLMRKGLPEHAAPDWMRITATEPRGNGSTIPHGQRLRYKPRAKIKGSRSIPVCYVNGDLVIRADSMLELSELIGVNRKSIERVFKTGGCLLDGGKVVAA